MDKISIRPIIKGLNIAQSTSQAEQFQQVTLRPIIKLQHDLLIAFFMQYLAVKKIVFESKPAIDKRQIITHIFKKDHRLKIELRGLIVGLFTVSEYRAYQELTADLNKRIVTIIQERLQSTLC